MFGLLARLLELLYSFWPSYAGSIILFTVVIMLVLAPLTFKSTRSMLAMQALQPEMKKLQNRYKDDRQKLNEEMMKFYQENKISPLGGCLPMLVQLPVFFILYEVLYKLTLRGPFGGDMGHAVACQMGGVNACTANGAFANAGFFHPAYLDPSSNLYQSLSHTRVMESFGLDLAQSAWSALGDGLAHAAPFVIMVLVVMALTYLQQQQIQSRQPKNAEQNPTQMLMMKIMPVAMGFIYIVIPAGVVVYFLVSSLFRIGQQAMVTRTFYSGPNAIVIPTTATEVDGSVKSNKSIKSQIIPGGDSLPRIGKKAQAKSSPAPQKGAPPNAKKKKAAASSDTPQPADSAIDESESVDTQRTTEAPNRSAPSRSAPTKKSGKGKK